MTNREAIDIIRAAQAEVEWNYPIDYVAAFDVAIKALERQEQTTAEIEGGGSSWWFVCEECRGAIDSWDHYCKHCGRQVIRNG
jgi:hypothetical protein